MEEVKNSEITSNRRTAEDSKSRRLLAVTLLLAFAAVFMVQGPRIIDPFAVEEDFRSGAWVYWRENPEIIGSNSNVIDIGPISFYNNTRGPAYGLLFELTNAVLDPILVSKLLAFPLLLASAYYLFRIGEE
ncbi:MAG: hypothetical protein WA996_02975, partial [Candidatus Promineifilaceae bacterium]